MEISPFRHIHACGGRQYPLLTLLNHVSAKEVVDSFFPHTARLVFLRLILNPLADYVRFRTSPASEPRTTSIAHKAMDRSFDSEGARSTSIDFLLKPYLVLASRVQWLFGQERSVDDISNKPMGNESARPSTTHVLALNLLPWNGIASRGKQGRRLTTPTPTFAGLPYASTAWSCWSVLTPPGWVALTHGPICLLLWKPGSLFSIRCTMARTNSTWASFDRLYSFMAPKSVDFLHTVECCGGRAGSVEVWRHEDEARSARALKGG